MCEVILYGDPDYSLYNDNWPAEHKKNALAYLKFLESFEFIFCVVTLFCSLLYLKEAIVYIQEVGQDVVSGVHSVMECCRELKGVEMMLMAFLIAFFSTAVGLLRSQVFLYLCRVLVDVNAIDLIQSSHQWKNISKKTLSFHFLIA